MSRVIFAQKFTCSRYIHSMRNGLEIGYPNVYVTVLPFPYGSYLTTLQNNEIFYNKLLTMYFKRAYYVVSKQVTLEIAIRILLPIRKVNSPKKIQQDLYKFSQQYKIIKKIDF